MVIILEGANGTGKTTLARHLIEVHGFIYHKDTGSNLSKLPPEYRIAATKEAIIAQAKLLVSLADNCNIVVDRFHLTEQVYGWIERFYRIGYCKEVEEILNAKRDSFLLVHVNKPYEYLAQQADKKHLYFIRDWYPKAFSESTMNKVEVDLDEGAPVISKKLGLPDLGKGFVFGKGKEVIK